MVKVSCVQLTSSASISDNIDKTQRLVEMAARKGASLVALPENVFLMRDSSLKTPDEQRFAQENHPGILAAQGWAKECGVWILIGSVAIAGAEKMLNRSLLIAPTGAVAAVYDKIHLFDVTLPGGEVYAESARFEAGNQAVLAKTAAGILGMTICYDVRFPHVYRGLAKAGAEIIAVPAAFTQTTGEAHWEILLRARAIENGCFVIAPAQVGTHAGGRKTYGHALIIDPWGRVLADGGRDEGIIIADIDLAEVAKVRASLPSLSHDRPFTLV